MYMKTEDEARKAEIRKNAEEMDALMPQTSENQAVAAVIMRALCDGGCSVHRARQILAFCEAQLELTSKVQFEGQFLADARYSINRTGVR